MTQRIFFPFGIQKKKTISDYKDVIFDESEYYNTYKKADLLTKAEKAEFVKF